jgi:acetoin utilization deacetylase AcuC-like enzyme
MKIVFSKKCLEYREAHHPESPERVKDTYNLLKKMGFEFIEPELCSVEDLLLVHSRELIESVRNGRFFDPDTPNLPGMFDYARLSAGAAIKACELALKGEYAFSLSRPPGHHATRDNLGGFCYFNNIAIAVKIALKEVSRVAIIDIDCHHGNGTEAIFMGSSSVFYVSLHQSPLYPGTGLKSRENCLNFPLPPGTEEKEWLEALDKAIFEVKKFTPELIAVSAGFDTYRLDPITNLNLEKESYRKIGERIASLNKPSFAVLEGGYGKDFPECVYNFLIGHSL